MKPQLYADFHDSSNVLSSTFTVWSHLQCIIDVISLNVWNVNCVCLFAVTSLFLSLYVLTYSVADVAFFCDGAELVKYGIEESSYSLISGLQ